MFDAGLVTRSGKLNRISPHDIVKNLLSRRNISFWDGEPDGFS